MKTFEVTPLGVIPGIQVDTRNDPCIEVGHFFRSRYAVSAKLDTSRFAEVPERIFRCDVVHGDEVKILPETEATVNQFLIYWAHFGEGDFVFRTEGSACEYLSCVTERVDKGDPGNKEPGFALLAGMVENSSIHLYRRTSAWSRFWHSIATSEITPELILVASLTLYHGELTVNPAV